MAPERSPTLGLRVAVAAAAVAGGCHCGGSQETPAARDERERPATVTEPSDPTANSDPFTEAPAPPLPSLERAEIAPPPIALSSGSEVGRVGGAAAVVARDWSKEASRWVTLDAAGAWSAPTEMPLTSTMAVTECGGAAVVSGSTKTDFVFFQVSRGGEVERELDIDIEVGDVTKVPMTVCTDRGPAFVWLDGKRALVVATESGKDVIELSGLTRSLAAVGAGDRVVVLRSYSELPEFSGKLEVLAVEDGAVAARLDVGDEPSAKGCILLARDGYLLALWELQTDFTIRAQVIAGDLSRKSPVRVVHTGEAKLRRLRAVESEDGRIAVLWEEVVPTMRLTADGHEHPDQNFYAALLDPLGRALGRPAPILPGAGQYFAAAWAGDHLLVYGGGRAASVERYRPEPGSR